jgi:hypothetical protein
MGDKAMGKKDLSLGRRGFLKRWLPFILMIMGSFKSAADSKPFIQALLRWNIFANRFRRTFASVNYCDWTIRRQ